MDVHLLRHACAGRKSDWQGNDASRPLDDAGRLQAVALGDVLANEPIRRLVSSPARRCMETLEPLAARFDLAIEPSETLEVGAPRDTLVAMLRDPQHDGAALCTHGEVMESLLDWVRARRPEIVEDGLDDEWLLAKGSAWRFVVEGGEVVGFRHVVPLPLASCPRHDGSD
ncbi:MAG TPA: phosphoglycerate mutase family protein [Acidimicrobiales bacterium]|nr:phosphoglycerate mutase family protein [Acidimicrobiales bacterium]